jgi:hypothetical protein
MAVNCDQRYFDPKIVKHSGLSQTGEIPWNYTWIAVGTDYKSAPAMERKYELISLCALRVISKSFKSKTFKHKGNEGKHKGHKGIPTLRLT